MNSFGAKLGATFYVRIGANYVSNPYVFGTVKVHCKPAPPNDLRANAERIVGTGQFNYNNVGADSEKCSSDVWFVWQATCTGRVSVTACGLGSASSIQRLAVSTSDRPSLLLPLFYCLSSSLVSVESGCTSTSSICKTYDSTPYVQTIEVVQGVDYYIAAGSEYPGALSFTLICSPVVVPRPSNDNCAGAISTTDGTTSLDNSYATFDLVPLTLADLDPHLKGPEPT